MECVDDVSTNCARQHELHSRVQPGEDSDGGLRRTILPPPPPSSKKENKEGKKEQGEEWGSCFH